MAARLTLNDRYNPKREDRLCGLFYFLWLGEHGRHQPYDISAITKADPDAGHKPDSPVWGGIGTYHHWGEPLYGYYYSDDEWVVRRHMKLLTQAGVDFLFFDTTNAVIYEHNAKLVMSVLDEYRREGWNTPKVMFYTNTASGDTAQRIYDSIYKPGFCPETWFRCEGKPVIIAKPEECSPEVREFFNIKLSQWPNEPDKRGGWPWMDFTRPQRAFDNLDGVPECINVSVAQHPQLRFGDSVLYGEKSNCGRAFHDGANDPSPDAYKHCGNFIEQFERAIEADVPVTLLTGWNEWIAGRWQGIPERPIMFVDCANYEYSRDIEMMRGGYGDNYYLTMCDYIRRLKGDDPMPVLEIGASLTFPGYPDGNLPRDHEGYGCSFLNMSGRHCIRSVGAENAEDCVKITVTTAHPIDNAPAIEPESELEAMLAQFDLSADRDGAFLWVFCETDGGMFLLNHTMDGGTASVMRVTEENERYTFTPEGTIPCSVDGNTLTLTVPKASIGLAKNLLLRVIDSRDPVEAPADFYDHGDCLPLGRMWYGVTVK
ncbi:MAG: hypothetical protein IJ037_01920 [Clostridia bacterium]|nr:hypothetical protein [Clostridia bacterium]